MSIPTEIWICGQRHAIVTDGEFANSRGVHGMIVFHECRIELNPRCGPDFLRETLFHEVCHGVDRLLIESPGITAALRRTPDERDMLRMTETEVLAFSRGLWMTLADPRNRAAVDWMLGREDAAGTGQG